MALTPIEALERYKKQKIERQQKEHDRIIKKLQKSPLNFESVSVCLKELINENAELKAMNNHLYRVLHENGIDQNTR